MRTELIYKIVKCFFLTHPGLGVKILPSSSQLPGTSFSQSINEQTKNLPVTSLPFDFLCNLGEANNDLLQKREINYSQNGKSKIFLL